MKLVPFTAALVLLTAVAQAAELQYSAQLDLELTPNGLTTGTLDVPKFPAALGPLRGVRFEVTLDSHNTLGIENLGKPSVVEQTVAQVLQLGVAGGAPVATAQLQSQNLHFMPAFDGRADFSGASGLQQALVGHFEQSTSLAPGPEFVSSPGPLLLDLQAYSALTLQSVGPLESQLQSKATVTVQVVYTY